LHLLPSTLASKPSWRLWPLLALLIVGALACSSDDPREPLDQTLTVALPSFWGETLDPSLDGQPGLQYHGHLYDHLVGIGPDGKFDQSYGLLESWGPGEDASTYTLTLKKDIKWHDGVDVTSADIVFSINYYAREDARCAVCPVLASIVENVEATDSRTVLLHLKNPHVSIMHAFGPVAGDMPLLAAHADGLSGGLGTGPWKMFARSPGEWIEFKANTDYWDEERVPGFARLRLVLAEQPAERAEMLKRGEVDMTVLRPSGRPWSIDEPQGDVPSVREAGFAIDGPKYVNTTVMRLFTASEPESMNNNLDFRKALTLGIDSQTIIDAVYEPEVAEIAAGSALFSPLSDGYDPLLPPYPYDLAAAAASLVASGYGGEDVVIFSAPSYGLTELIEINEMIAENLRDIGMNVEVRTSGYPEILARHSTRPQQFEDVMPAPLFHGVNYQTWPDILGGIKRYLSSDSTALLTYHDLERGDQLFDELSAIVDPVKRDARLRQLNREMYEEYWAIPVVWRHEVYGLRSDLSGWAPTDGTASDLRLETVRGVAAG
jgi:peptide/nickel transport system substrate-binding protein